VTLTKHQEAGKVKRLMSEQKQMKARFDHEGSLQWSEHKQKLKEDRINGLSQMNHFLFMKQEMARLDKEKQLNDEQQQITDYENEARYLEQLESELIRKLQET
jgi:hypothetical protein